MSSLFKHVNAFLIFCVTLTAVLNLALGVDSGHRLQMAIDAYIALHGGWYYFSYLRSLKHAPV
jgi:hypothetical protein